MRHVILAILLIFSRPLHSLSRDERAEQLIRQITEIESKYGVHIHFEFEIDEAFPGGQSVYGKEVHKNDRLSTLKVIHRFIEKHPEAVIREHLSNIYAFKSLQIKGRQYGGTYSKNNLYVISSGGEGILHHEFSSILMKSKKFPKDEWIRINPGSHDYSGTGFEVLRKGNLHHSGADTYRDGFLMNYSKSSMENDFNVISDYLFMKPDDLFLLSESYERIKQKRELAIQFYKSINTNYFPDVELKVEHIQEKPEETALPPIKNRTRLSLEELSQILPLKESSTFTLRTGKNSWTEIRFLPDEKTAGFKHERYRPPRYGWTIDNNGRFILYHISKSKNKKAAYKFTVSIGDDNKLLMKPYIKGLDAQLSED